VYFLTDKKDNNRKFVVICAHFKSKDDGLTSRRKTGHEISQLVKTIRDPESKSKADDKTNLKYSQWLKDLQPFQNAEIILMGDLNAEIDEIAFDLDSNILRYKDQTFNKSHDPIFKVGANSLIPWFGITKSPNDTVTSIHQPEDEFQNMLKLYKESLIRLNDIQDIKEVLDQSSKSFAEPGNKPQNDPSDTSKENVEKFDKLVKGFDKDLSEIELTIKIMEEQLKSLLTLKDTPSRMTWIETNNFKTERKIRLKEIDYDNPYYKRILNNLAYFQTVDKSLLKDDSLEFLINGKVFPIPAKTFGKMSPTNGPSYMRRFQDVGIFIETFEKIEQILEKLSKKQLTNKSKVQYALFSAYRHAMYGLLFETEKIDFILLNSPNKVTIKEIRSINNYGEVLTYGAPNNLLKSDHFPSRVELQFDSNTGFGEKVSEFLSSLFGNSLPSIIKKSQEAKHKSLQKIYDEFINDLPPKLNKNKPVEKPTAASNMAILAKLDPIVAEHIGGLKLNLFLFNYLKAEADFVKIAKYEESTNQPMNKLI
jgi:hypothetical protein